MMRRAANALDRTVDLLVIGGGVYGAWIAYDAALRGLSVILVERTDWAAGTSSASSKLIHGGLRYLEYGHLGLVRKALVERRRLLRLAPHRVRALRFLLPVHRDARAGRIALELGLSLYDLLAGELGGPHAHRSYGREALLARCPFIERSGLVSGFSYSDASEDDARYCLELVDGAIGAGAAAVNACEALALTSDSGGRVFGARVRDAITGSEHEIRAGITVAAAGPWTQALVTRDPRDFPVRLTKGVHLVMPPLPMPEAMLLTTRSDRRVFFLIPWYGATLLGTTDTDVAPGTSETTVSAADVDYLLRAVEERCPGLGWRRRHVRGSFAGVRTLRAEGSKSPSSVTREWSLESPRPGLLVPVGGKLTSARVEAAATVARVQLALGRTQTGCPTAERPFPWAPPGDFDTWEDTTVRAGVVLGMDEEVARACARRHGTTTSEVHALVRERPEL
ncbi:MAG: glycerol-3-phosphate dehydrogenase/oxidase, partial [Planctomycetes bacterium]|nr:glycerol-3-phosphate dehydrogenase/oxidase [Planctomycetota bacterium]